MGERQERDEPELDGSMALATNSYSTAQRGDEVQDFERLFVTEYSRVVAIANRVLADAHEAEDVAQEVFYSFHKRHPASAAYAGAWLHAAAAHAALNVLRGKRRRFRRETTEAAAGIPLQAAAELELDPQATLEREEQRREVRAALTRLPERQSAALVLRHSGLSYAEVAAAVGLPVDQVGTILRRAEAALRKEVTGEARR